MPTSRPTRKAPMRKPTRRHKAGRHNLVRTLPVRLGVILLFACLSYLAYTYVVAPRVNMWKALYGEEQYPAGYSIRGIDISHYQGKIDWEKLRKAQIGNEPISFVFIKATEGRSLLDENFNDNFYQARESGMLRGAYHYFKPRVSAKDQARYFIKQVKLEDGDLPPVLDIEEEGNLSPAELRQAALTWLRIVEKEYKVKPILYTNYKFKQSYLSTKEFEPYPYWIAHYYVPDLVYKGAWKFWQHTDCGKLDGIKGKVDLNIYNGTYYSLKRMCLGN